MEAMMTQANKIPNDLSNVRPALLGRAKQLAAALLSERGEASGALVARQLHETLRALDADDRHGFQRYLAADFQPDKAALRAAAQRKPRPRSPKPSIRPARNCCGE
jgi:malonyl-CoA decarboxylase